MNIERTRIHFLTDVFASAAVLGFTYLQLEWEDTLNRRSTSGTLNTPSSPYTKSLLSRGEGWGATVEVEQISSYFQEFI